MTPHHHLMASALEESEPGRTMLDLVSTKKAPRSINQKVSTPSRKEQTSRTLHAVEWTHGILPPEILQVLYTLY